MTEQQILESTYKHKVTIIGHREIETDYGETKFQEIIVAENVKCGLSQGSRNFNTTQTDMQNDIKYVAKLFCSPDIDIKIGDKLSVTFSNGLIREYTAGEYLFYESHLEVPLLREGEA